MEYKVRYIGPDSMFTHPGITRVGKHPYVFVGRAYTQIDNKEDYDLFASMDSFEVLKDVTIEPQAIKKEVTKNKKDKKGEL